MFDIGFFELLLVAVIALIVLGPERLPIAVKKMIYWKTKISQRMDKIKTEVEQEFQVDDIKRDIYNENILNELAKQSKNTTNQDVNKPVVK